jgi:hypothetical protein
MKDDFESQLKNQPLQRIPSHWRQQILTQARREASANLPPEKRVSFWRELFWPCPQVWAGFAAVWLLVLLLNISLDRPAVESMARSEPPLENREGYAQRQQLLVEILDDVRAVSTAPAFVPRRRSDLSGAARMETC